MAETVLDAAHAAMQADDADDTARLRFYERLADAELFLLLAAEPTGDQVEPQVFEVEDGAYVLVFDREERLAEFVGQAAPYAALSGRAIAGMLAGQGGIGLNLSVAPSSILIPAEAVEWLAQTLSAAPAEVQERPVEIKAPVGIPQELLGALDTKLAACSGLARSAYLVAVTFAPARAGHLLAFVDALEPAQAALSQAISEALVFSGIEAGEIDVGFFDASDPIAARLAKVGLRFDIPQPEVAVRIQPAAPGMDPDRPPKLR